jgi:hypothetical protein
MTLRRILQALAIWIAFLAAHAAAQQTAPNKIAVVQDVADRCPGLVMQDHAFTDAVASVLNAQDARWGRNGKRGNVNDPSHDALAFKNPESRAGGVSVIDIIVGAGGQFATAGWQDVTQATIDAGTIGAWVAPSGRLPACLTLPPGPVPPTAPPTTDTDTVVALRELAATLVRIEVRLAAIESRPVPDFLDVAVFNAFIDDMVGKGPAGDPQLMPNHITDVKERLDVIRINVEQLNAWLRSRTILRR